jgi:hypothetical protein
MLLKATMALVVACAGLVQQGSDTGAVRDWGKQSGPFQLSISTDKQQYVPGELIKLTAVIKNVSDGGFVGMSICAGAETTDQFDLNKLYSMSTPGDYRVTFSCKLPQKAGDPNFAITSNNLKITILPDKK